MGNIIVKYLVWSLKQNTFHFSRSVENSEKNQNNLENYQKCFTQDKINFYRKLVNRIFPLFYTVGCRIIRISKYDPPPVTYPREI